MPYWRRTGGLLTLAREIVPDVLLHASTQMSLFTLGGANEAAALGMERVVLARELSRDEVREICAGCPAEIEIFVHGALCMCYSGQCEMSAVVGERSGNRGACAQPCRLPYGVDGPCRGGHPLSLKDANLSAYLAEMDEIGVDCLKLEGRMKRPEYVAVVTGIYRRLMDEKRRPTAEESRRLEQAFSRSGFTDGYWLDKKDPQMFGIRPENAPEPKELFTEVREQYENGRENRRIPVSLAIRVQAGKPVSLAVGCQSNNGLMNVWAQGPVPETARSRALTAEELRERLSKTGGTVFTVEQFRAELDDGLMLPASVINGLRRDALEELKQRLEQDWFLRRMSPWQKEELRQGRDPHVRRVLEAAALPEAPEPPADMGFTCSVLKAEQVTGSAAGGEARRRIRPHRGAGAAGRRSGLGWNGAVRRAAPRVPDGGRDAAAAAAGAAPGGVLRQHRQSGPPAYRAGAGPDAAGRLRTEHFQLPRPAVLAGAGAGLRRRVL